MQIASVDCILINFMNKNNFPFLRIFFAAVVMLVTVGILILIILIIRKCLSPKKEIMNEEKSQ